MFIMKGEKKIPVSVIYLTGSTHKESKGFASTREGAPGPMKGNRGRPIISKRIGGVLTCERE